jgi:hypothetical protein
VGRGGGGVGGSQEHIVLVFEIYFKQRFEMPKNSMKFFAHSSRHSMFSQSCFTKNDIFCVMCKKDKFW